MNLFAALGGELGIDADLVDRYQPSLSELDHQLDAIVRIHGGFAKLVGLGFGKGIAPFCGGGHA
jgi:hypothetical protein